ncbi:hypothetical protein [Changpingibacter yushuensis]|uniref:hypothetical protein n=1 Tax=Changpingibacter yushuensis TaxID=2758440 RepID=UPI00165E820C|nr:hypothetical protein [Changpingibacter yushuensis]
MGEIHVEVGEGPAGQPIATIVLDGFDSPSTATVSRIVSGRDALIRGGRDVTILGSGSLIDWDVPLGHETTYVVSTSTERLTATVTVPSGVGWISDPQDPSVAVAFAARPGMGTDLIVTAGALESGRFSAESSTTSILGADLPVATGGTRMRAASLPITVVALTREAVDGFTELLRGGSVLVFRPTPRTPLMDPVSYVLLPDVTVKPVGARRGRPETLFESEGTLVRPLARPVAWTFWTYSSALALYVSEDGMTALTYTQVAAIAATNGFSYAGVARDPRMGGALG